MLNMVLEEIAKVLKDDLKEKVPPDNINFDKSAFDSDFKPTDLPLIHIYDDGFSLEDIGYGSMASEIKAERKEQFSGDGKKKIFKLSEKALRPIIEVIAHGSIVEEFQDYRMDYSKSTITFFHPPTTGTNNIQVRYTINKSLGEVRGLRLRISCFIDILDDNNLNCNSITVDVMKSLLEKKEQLVNKGIVMVPQKGLRLPRETAAKRNFYARRLIYEAQVEFQTKIKAPVIDEVRIAENSMLK